MVDSEGEWLKAAKQQSRKAGKQQSIEAAK